MRKKLLSLAVLSSFLPNNGVMMHETTGSSHTEDDVEAKAAREAAAAKLAEAAKNDAIAAGKLSPTMQRVKKIAGYTSEILGTGMLIAVCGGMLGFATAYGAEKGRNRARNAGQQPTGNNEGNQGGSMSTSEAGSRGGQASRGGRNT